MLSSINPLGERARGQRFETTVAWYLLGSVMGGAAIGWLGGLCGTVLPEGRWKLVAVVLLSIAGVVTDITGRRPVSIHRQVNEDWLGRYRGWVYGVGFGFQLGLAVVTIVTTASVYVMLAVVVLIGSPLWGLGIGAAFGMSRGLAILRVARVTEPGSLRAVMRSLQSGVKASTAAAIGSQAAVALVAVGALL